MKQATGFTLVEMLVTVGLIAVVVGLLMPALAAARRAAGQAQCASNLRQWAIAVNAYADQYNHWLPRRGQGINPGSAAQMLSTANAYANWFNVLPPFLGGPSYDDMYFNSGPTPQIPRIGDASVWICPELYGTAANGCLFGYAMNMALSVEIAPQPDRIDKIGSAATMVFMTDGPAGFCSTVPFLATASAPAMFNPVARHRGNVNVAFLDGHVDAYSGNYLGCNIAGDTVHPDACNQPEVRWYWYVPGPAAPWGGP